MEAEILATCNALGIVIRGVYEKGTDCLDCLKDLLRYLRKDDENHSVLCFLGCNNLLEDDLLPLIKRYENETEIFDFTLRLLVALSSPALLHFQEEIPEDKISNNIYLQLITYLQNYKKSFCDLEVWKALARQMAKILKQRPVERSEEEGLILERILIVIRNILHVPTHELTSFQTDNDMSLQDKIIWKIHEANIDVLFLYMCANEDESSYCLHMVEMVHLMLQEHLPETLASTIEQRSGQEKERDVNALMAVRQREQNLKLKKVQSMGSARFNGVYCVKNMKSLSNNDYISHKFITNLDDVKFDEKKTAKRIPKNRVPLKDTNTSRMSTLYIRLFLKKFCIEFLKSYNKLMSLVKRELLRKASAESDDTYYLWAIEYFMKFNRLNDFQPALISETISMQMFHHIQTQITNYHEMMQSDKKKSSIWSKRMRLGVSAYKELLQTVFTMTKSKDPVLQQNADIIVSNVFYVIEYREMLLSLLSNFDEVKFSLAYLSELVESTYMFLKMLENHSKRHSEIIIQKRKKKVKRRKKKKPTAEPPKPVDLEEEWLDFANSLSAAVQGRRNVPSDSFPFDGASEVPFEEQKVDAMYKIRHALVSKQAEQAVSLLRSARELWPDGDSFGAADIDSEDEFMVLREIYLSNIENPHPENNPAATEEPESRDETDEEMEAMSTMTEQQLDLNDMYKRYASHKVVRPCCLLLANYQSNSSHTNISLIKLLHRIAWDCKMHALFFQSTTFLTFQKIFQDPDVSTNPATKELYRFAKYILSKFFEAAQKNEKVFVEMLFWKGAKEAYELEEGYDTAQSTMKGAWTEKEEEELRELYEENKDIYIEGQDVADIILASIENRKRNKHQIILALKRIGLIKSARDLKPHLRKDWTEDEVIELQNLFGDLKDSEDVMGGILNGLSIKRSRKTIVEKLLELNLIQDKKEVYKKRSKNSKKADENESDADSFIENSEDEDGDVPSGSERRRKPGEDSSENEGEEENFFQQLKAQRSANQGGVSQVDSKDVYEGVEMEDETSDLMKIFKAKKASKNESCKQSCKSLPEVWQEQEIMELNTIFNSNRDSPDIMNAILNSLTTKRSKQSIIEKLLEVGLIKDKKEIRKKRTQKAENKNGSLNVSSFVMSDSDNEGNDSENGTTFSSSANKKNIKKVRQILSDSEDEELVNNNDDIITEPRVVKDNKVKKSASTPVGSQKARKRPPKVWDETEIVQLRQLFEKFRDSNDIIGSILSELTVKRPKESVIEKLLEVRLIEDRKEVRKKRQKQDETRKQKKRDKLDNNEIQDVVPSGNKKQRKKVINSILSDSSEDETVPLSNKTKDVLPSENKTQPKKVNNSILSDSSEDETVTLNNKHKQDKKDETGNNKTDDALLNDIKKRKEKVENSILSDSSEDDSVPLGKILRNDTAIAKKVESKIDTAVLSDDSDDLPLRIIQNYKDSPERNKPSSSRKKSLSDSVKLNNDKVRSGTSHSSNYPKAKFFQIVYDSSEDETLPLTKMQINGKEVVKRVRKKVVTELLPNIPGSDPLSNVQSNFNLGDDSDEERNEISLKDSSSTNQKRKRLFIDDSEESEDEDHSIKTELNIPSQFKETQNDGTLNRSKKRARVLVDSDESE